MFVQKVLRPSDLFAPSFKEVYQKFFDDETTHIFMKGGRGSTKSTAAAILIKLGMMRDHSRGERTSAIVFRRVDNTLRLSVYSQMIKADDFIGNAVEWKYGLSPLMMTYKINGAEIQFHGVDDPLKLKSLVARFGYFKYVWIEEAAEFDNMEHIRSILQTVMRGGEKFKVLYTFNPPKDAQHWINVECEIPSARKFVHHSVYTDVPRHWLSEEFFREAEELKERNFPAYEHEYLGIATGVEGQIFPNVTIEKIPAATINGFKALSCGLDWGFSIDPLAVVWMAYDSKTRTLYLFDEVYRLNASNEIAAKEIQRRRWNRPVICDSAEPKSIADVSGYGVRAIPARKGKGSIERGMKWLRSYVHNIVIDPERCPNAAREFRGYAFDKDASGTSYKRDFPDRDNHTIDAVRYGCQDWMAVSRIR